MEKLKDNQIIVWKRCVTDNKSRNGFEYPRRGYVEAPDWNEEKKCGGGLHGWTQGFEGYFDPNMVGNMVVILVNKNDGYVELEDKIKFRKGKVLLNTPDIQKAHDLILSYYPNAVLHYNKINQGDNSTVNQGNYSAAIQGDDSTANQGNYSTANQGNYSTANQGCLSTANQGDSSTANQGYSSTAIQGNYSAAIQGDNSVANQGSNSVGICYGSNYIYRGGTNSYCVLFDSGRRYIFTNFEPWETVYIKNFKIIKKYKHTPEEINKYRLLLEHEVFVFGSNIKGNHAGGAAKLAVEKFGAVEGIVEVLQGQSYAFPTLDENMNRQTEERLLRSVENLCKCAYTHTRKIFLVTKVGCGIAGFPESYMRDIFGKLKNKIPANIILPEGWLTK